jgi:hypothetical protein
VVIYVEDILLAIRAHLSRAMSFDGVLDDVWSQNFVHSVSEVILTERSLSTNQARVILNMIRRVRRQLVRYGTATDDDIDVLLRHPQYRRPLYESSYVPREARYVGDNLIALRFKQHDSIVERIKELGKPALTDWSRAPNMVPKPQFNWDYRIWIVPVMHYNVLDLFALLNEYRFHLDPVTFTYLRVARHSLNKATAVTRLQDSLVVHVSDHPILAGWITEIANGLAL